VICAACRQTRELADLMAFWPIGRPEQRRYVCRPTCPTGRAAGPCFYQVVGTATVHDIELAARSAAFVLPAREPVVPRTSAWAQLLQQAGVRSIAA
jgi:hypothetical protein